MPLIYDVVTAPNIAGYFNASQQNVDATVGELAFPAKKQLGLKLAFIKGASGRAVALKPAAFDTNVTLRDRIGVTISEEEMPFFKEALLVKETDRQQFNILAQTNNTDLVDALTEGIFNDQATLIQGARARLEAMRMQVLATGKIAINANGVAKDVDYGVQDDHKHTVAKAWTAADATPLADIEDAIDKAGDAGLNPEVVYLNNKTFSQIRKADATVKTIKPLAGDGAAVTRAELTAYLEDNYGVQVVVISGTYKNDKGEVAKLFPDGHVTLAPNASLGSTVFGTTPEESDLLNGDVPGAEVEVVETGIAVTTTKLTDPVNVQTKVSMIALPSFERLDDAFFLTTVPVG